MSTTTFLVLALAAVMLAMAGCAVDGDATARRFIAEMDARPAGEQVPNWGVIRGLMTREAPAVGTLAPDFALETDDGTATIRLSDFRGERPVVLIFGSWT